MLHNYLKIALRSIKRQKLFATINIGGLALGIAAAFVLGLYVRQELTYDRHFENSNRIYRVATGRCKTIDFDKIMDFTASPTGGGAASFCPSLRSCSVVDVHPLPHNALR